MRDRWFRYHRRVVSPQARLICLPHAGGTASFFRSWPHHLDPSIEVIAVRYPGREDRLHEPCIVDMPELADRIAHQIETSLPVAGPPLVLFGHSMGASVAHEVTVRLESKGRSIAGLLISARPAPQRLRPNDLTQQLDNSALIADVRRLDTRAAEVLDNPDLLEVVLPAIRADYTLVETYPRHLPKMVSAPIVGYAATADPEVSEADVLAWSQVTTGSFDLRVFDGDHFYLVEHEASVVADVNRQVQPRFSARHADSAPPA